MKTTGEAEGRAKGGETQESVLKNYSNSKVIFENCRKAKLFVLKEVSGVYGKGEMLFRGLFLRRVQKN